MAYKIVWSAEAENDFKNIIVYLKEKWSVETAKKFIDRSYRRFEKLATMPTVARLTSKRGVYLYKLDRQNVVFFSIEEDYLILLSIYPYKKDITKSKYY